MIRLLPPFVSNLVVSSLRKRPSIALLSTLAITGLFLFSSFFPQVSEGQSTPLTTQHEETLEQGAVRERAISIGEAHAYRVQLGAGQYLRIAVEQHGVAVTTAVFLENGIPSNEKGIPQPSEKATSQKLIEVDSAGIERASVISTDAASYRIVIQASKSQSAGHYLIKIEEKRPAYPQDQTRVAAEKAMADAVQFTRQNKREALLKSAELYRMALGLWQSLPDRQMADRQQEAQARYLLALRHQDLGDIQQGIGHALEALAISRETFDRIRETAVLNALGSMYFALGDKMKAVAYFEQALSASRIINDQATELAVLINMGVAYKSAGASAQAIDIYQQALPTARAIGDLTVEAAALTNLARLYDLQGDRQRALEHNQQALKLWRKLENTDGEATALKNLGALQEASRNYREALSYFQQALALSETLGDLHREAHIRGDLARLYRTQGDLKNSGAQIERSLAIFESLRGKLVSPDLRSSFLAAQRRYYEFYVSLLMQMHQAQPSAGHDTAALRVSERARARSLVEMLQEARTDIRQGVDISLLERERSLEQMLQAKEQERLRLSKRKAPVAAIAEVEQALLSLSTEYEQVQTKIRQASPHYASLTQPQILSLADMQKQLVSADTLLLEYGLGEERSFLWVVSDTSLQSFSLPPRAEIEQTVRKFYEALTARGRTVKFETEEKRQARIARADAEYAALAQSLSQMLLGPARELLGQKRLLIVPDRVLHYVPFGALPENGLAGQAQDATPLIVNHEVVHLPSATSLAVLRQEIAQRTPAPKSIAVLADPVFDSADQRVKAVVSQKVSSTDNVAQHTGSLAWLRDEMASSLQNACPEVDRVETRESMVRLPYTRKEAQAIMSLAPTANSKIALDFDADRKAATDSALGQYRYLHFATHGLLNDKHPALSGLALSFVGRNGVEQDGYLRAMDIFNMKLPAELVVLSGCRTGLGKEVRGEGMIGLTRSFMYAGAARVLVSLWNINDQATADWMERFYRELLGKGQSPAAALRAAQIALWKEKQWQAPYYWAAFVLQGEPR